MVVALERLDEQVVDREPNGSPPVRIPSEQATGTLRGIILHPELLATVPENVWVSCVNARDGSNSVTRKKLAFIEQIAKHARQSLLRWDRKQSMRVLLVLVRRRGHVRCVFRELWPICDKPIQSLRETRQLLD